MKQKKTKLLSFLLAVLMLLSVPMTSMAREKDSDAGIDIVEELGKEPTEDKENEEVNQLEELIKLKTVAQKEVEVAAEEKIKEINEQGKITEEEKISLIEVINNTKATTLAKIENANTESEINDTKIKGISAIKDITLPEPKILMDEVNPVAEDGINSFPELKDAIENGAEGATIEISGDIVFTETINVPRGMTISGTGTLTVDGNFRHFTTDADVTFGGVTLDGENKGGGIQVNSGNLTLNSVSINNCTADKGGAVYANEGTITIDKGNFSNNTAIGSQGKYKGGGAIFIDSDNKGTTEKIHVIITESKFENNSASAVEGKGGAIYIGESQNTGEETLTIKGTSFSGNKTTGASGDGGALYSDADDIVMEDVTFEKNQALGFMEFGGDLYNMADGGAMSLRDSSLEAKNITATGNTATGSGGALSLGGDPLYNTIELKDSTFSKNISKGHGGAISINQYGNVNIDNTKFIENSALGLNSDAGALYLVGSTVTINNNSEFNNNAADRWGGAVVVYDSITTINNSDFIGNKTAYEDEDEEEKVLGGAIYVSQDNSSLNVNESNFENNKATYGGGIHIESANSVEVSNSNFTNNSSAVNGGAINVLPREDRLTLDSDSTYYNPLKVSNTKFEANKADNGFYYLDEEIYKNINTVYGTNVQNIKELSGDDTIVYPTGILHNKAYNNYDISFVGGLIVVYDGNGSASGDAPQDDKIYEKDEDVTILGKNTLEKKGYSFLGWSTDKDAKTAQYKFNSDTGLIEPPTFEIKENTILYAVWDKLESTKTDNVSGSKVKVGDTFKYTITAKNNSDISKKNVLITDNIPSKLDIISVTPKDAKISGQKIEYTVPEIKIGETFTMTIEVKVNSSAKDGDKIKNIAVVDGQNIASRQLEVTNKSDSDSGTGWTWSGGGSTTTLNKDDHYAYMIGYPNGTVKPEGKITRAEVSTIFFRMMADNSRNSNWSSENNYNDVGAETWYNNAISTLSNAKAVTGYPDGSFKPNAKITRGEFATMASRFLSDTSSLTNNKFTDVKGNWAESEINKLASLGLISGYTDGSFKPDQEITRAEAATLMNAVLERTPDKDHLLSNMKTWTDNSNKNAWYYAQIQEATNSHTYTRPSKTSIETWRELLPVRDWTALEKAWSNANSASGGGSVIK